MVGVEDGLNGLRERVQQWTRGKMAIKQVNSPIQRGISIHSRGDTSLSPPPPTPLQHVWLIGTRGMKWTFKRMS